MSHVNTSLALVVLILLPTIAIAAPVQALTQSRAVIPIAHHVRALRELSIRSQFPAEVSTRVYDISVNVGEIGQVRLDTNPSTGCEWWVESAPNAVDISVSSDINPAIDCGTPPRAGCSNQVAVYSFSSNTPGHYTIELRYGHPWAHNEYYEVALVNLTVINNVTTVCSEGAVNVLEACPDGTWKHRQVCRNNAWHDENQQCTTPSGPNTVVRGNVVSEPLCDENGKCWIKLHVTEVLLAAYPNCQFSVGNTITVETNSGMPCVDRPIHQGDEVEVAGIAYSCQSSLDVIHCEDGHYIRKTPGPSCPEGDVHVLEMCPDGVNWKQREVCRNNNWVPEQQTCPVPPQPGTVKILDAKLVQAVYDVPMIANKPTVLYARLYSSSQTEITTDITIKFGNTVISELGLQVLPEAHDYWLPEKGRYFVFETAGQAGANDVVLEIRPHEDEATLLASYTLFPEVVSTKGFRILFIPVELKPDQYLPNGSPAPDIAKYCAESDPAKRGILSEADYIRSVLPVPTQGGNAMTIDCSRQPVVSEAPHDFIKEAFVANQLRLEARNRGYDLGIGVVGDGGLILVTNGEQEEFCGEGIPMIGAIIEDSPNCEMEWLAAHELGHVYGLLHDNDKGINGFRVITGQPVQDALSLMDANGITNKWITRGDYSQLTDEFRQASLLNDVLLIGLEEKGEKLYLHAYDSQGRHVGFNPSSGAPEIQIPGASYLDTGKVIMIVVPSQTDVRVVVDASQATAAQEDYTLLCVSAVGESSSFGTSTETISSGENQEYSLGVSGTTVTIHGVTWLDRHWLWILLGVILTISTVSVAVYANRRNVLATRRNKVSSRKAGPRVKEIRSTASKPRVKSIQEAGTKPRVLKIEED